MKTLAIFPLSFLLGHIIYPDIWCEGQCHSFAQWMASKHRQERAQMGERSIVPVGCGLGNVTQKQQCAPVEEGAAFGTRDRV